MSDITYNDFSYLHPHKAFISRKEFWEEVIVQLNKDFAIGTQNILLAKTDLNGEEVAETLVKELEKGLPSLTPKLSEILYRIDVSEKRVESLKNLPGDLYYRCLAEIILQRTILKIITRKVYSNK